MARYKGRHRKPTHTGRNLAAVSTSGAFLAAGLTTTTGEAQAATPWDVIAECESGNRNVENSSSSASGFFQIIDGTWRANGGLQFAPRAILASKAEQLIVAQRIAQRRGSLADWNASKGCWGDQISSAVPSRAVAEPAPSATPAPRPTTPARADRDCVDFRYQEDAQDYFNAMGYSAGNDPERLDNARGDGNGIACESLPKRPRASGDSIAQLAAPSAKGKPSGKASKPTVGKPAAGKPTATSSAAAPAGGNAVTAAAKNLLGTPYVWGGTTASGVDCSGLVYNALRQAGHSPPRTAAALQDWATPVSQSQARAGDLFFWSDGGGTATHTGIYLGAGKVIEASQPGTVVTIRAVYPGITFGRIPT